MKKILTLTIPILLVGCGSIHHMGAINGVNIDRVTTRGVFSPASTTLIASDPLHKGEINVLSSAHGPGLIPAIATAGGIAGGAALLRPARTQESTSVNSTTTANGGGASASATATGGAASGGAGFVPPGQLNNPGHGH